jgi:aspartyl-tRNA(Asn)/glutamyl-tRNA(Gln) amidotransferase subunit A
MATELTDLTALELADQIGSKAVSPMEVIAAVHRRLDETEPFLNAYITRLDEAALAQAKEAELEITAGHYRGPLHGVPVAVKDNIAVAGAVTTAGSKVLANNLTTEDAEVVRRLRAAGAIIVGKTNMFEMAAGPRSTNEFYGNARNPWGPNHDASGSSGGSGITVAARQVPLSLGTDAGGSVRMPAAVTGTVGFKQTHGLVSARGLLASGNVTGDHIGPFGRTVADVALILEAMAGYDAGDPTSANRPVPAFREALRTRLTDVRVGVPTSFFFDLLHPEVEHGVRIAIGVLEQLGATVVPIDIPDLEDAMAARVPLSAEGLALHDPYLREHGELYSEPLRRQLLANYFIPGRDLARANRVRRLIKERFQAAFQKVDLLATPACVTPALPLTDQTITVKNFRTGELEEGPIARIMVRMTAMFNSTGLPAISVPAGFTDGGFPIGLQLVGRAYEDALVLGAAHAYEQATNWHTVKPPYTTSAVPA